MSGTLLHDLVPNAKIYEYEWFDGEQRIARHNLTDDDLRHLTRAAKKVGGIAIPMVDAAQIRWASGAIRGATRYKGVWYVAWFLPPSRVYEYHHKATGLPDTTPNAATMRDNADWTHSLPSSLSSALLTIKV